MFLFGKKKQPPIPPLTRRESFAVKPVLGRLVKVERGPDGNLILHVPRRQTAAMKAAARWFGLPPYKKVALDALGSFVIQQCDGTRTVREVVDSFAERFKLNRREAEISTATFLRILAERSIISLVLEEKD